MKMYLLHDNGEVSASVVLRKAANLIEEKGHTKQQLKDNLTGAMCLRGAMNAVVTGDACKFFDDRRLMSSIGSFIESTGVRGHISELAVIDWNNADERTPQEVIAVLRRTADMVEAKERLSDDR